MRSVDERIADVRRLVEAAARVVATRSTLVAEISESTGLSPAGVELALTRHVETDARDDDLHALVDRAGDAPCVGVILSANVFVGALRAIAVARAAAPRVVVRPSRRDPAFARALVDAAADPAITLVAELAPGSFTCGELHVYGRDATITDVRRKGLPGIRVRGHGAGMGVAWISGTADLTAAAEALADDVVVFDQRGCLSPRIALVEGPPDHAVRFGRSLHAALERRELAVPRGALGAEERAAADRYVATMSYAGRAFVGPAHAVGVAAPGSPLLLPPTHRHVHVASCPGPGEGRTLLETLRPGIVAIGSDSASGARTIAPSWARISALGEMQRPRLDGPVDARESG